LKMSGTKYVVQSRFSSHFNLLQEFTDEEEMAAKKSKDVKVS
jgi:hypothetical protein